MPSVTDQPDICQVASDMRPTRTQRLGGARQPASAADSTKASSLKRSIIAQRHGTRFAPAQRLQHGLKGECTVRQMMK